MGCSFLCKALHNHLFVFAVWRQLLGGSEIRCILNFFGIDRHRPPVHHSNPARVRFRPYHSRRRHAMKKADHEARALFPKRHPRAAEEDPRCWISSFSLTRHTPRCTDTNTEFAVLGSRQSELLCRDASAQPPGLVLGWHVVAWHCW